jgi:hypothetical protein
LLEVEFRSAVLGYLGSAHGAMFIGAVKVKPSGAKQSWKTSNPPRVKYFF